MTEVVAALIWEDVKFMICQRPAHKARGLLWEFVGGKVEPGETKEQALIRECQEELAVTLSVGDVFMDVVHEYPDITVHLTLFNATIAEGIPQKLEHNDIKWITQSEIPNYEFCPADEEILAKIQEKHGDCAVWYRNKKGDKIWWKDTSNRCGEWVFSFDKITEFNMFADYPNMLTAEQKAIFDKENPYWKKYFEDRQ